MPAAQLKLLGLAKAGLRHLGGRHSRAMTGRLWKAPQNASIPIIASRARFWHTSRALEAVGPFRPAMGIGGERRPGQYPKIR